MTDMLGYIFSTAIQFCYRISGSYVLAIIIFTFFTKVVLLPLSLWSHANSLKMVSLMPEINRLKVKYYGDREQIGEEQAALYKRARYKPLLSLVPLVFQIIILSGMVTGIHSITDTGVSPMLGLIPFETEGWTLIAPLLAGLAAFTLGQAQNRLNPLQREQSKAEQWATNGISIAISLCLGVFVSLGVVVYWIFSNLFSILNQIVCNSLIDPDKHVDYAALKESKAELDSIDQLNTDITPEEKKREKADYKRFFSIANKHLVFYSEKSGFYKYFKNVIEYLIKHSNVIIHYVTNDPKDKIFEFAKAQPHIKPYYIGQKRLITLMMKMDADIVVMTTPGLDNYYLKRSYIRKDIEYIYMFHGIASTQMVVPKASYDNFDTIFCGGQHHIDELREAEKMYDTKVKTLVPCGYGLFDNLISEYEKMGEVHNPRPKILIAPSWQEENIMDSCIDELISQLAGNEYDLIVRPHPEYIKRNPNKIKDFLARYQTKMNEHFMAETDFSSNTTIFMADLVITDWSGIAYEFSFSTLQPSLFIDTPMKVLNPEYTRYKSPLTDLVWRNLVGVSLPLDGLTHTRETVEKLIAEKESYRQKIKSLREKCLFNIGKSGEVGGKYILEKLIKSSSKR